MPGAEFAQYGLAVFTVAGADDMDIKHFWFKLIENPVVKALVGFFIWIISILYGDFRAAYGVVMVLVVADWITGMWFAWHDPESIIKSSRLKSGAVKLALYAFLLALGHLCSLVEMAAFVRAFIEGYIVMTEGVSVLENLNKICDLHGKDIPMLKRVMGLLQGKLNEMEVGKYEQKRVRPTDDNCRPRGTESRSGF